ncbi:hypothetical protein [Jiangella asiatica]|uniref:Uncharacterized protein n=1 Tax=Jiangella asiatica TaxID=2530372 RepID=A0A4R5DE75_9ACTN|nr:hypothetical protein [Jiangella asiatica]TDE10151.1 hypothetical protein E1269_12610 [Jiangella asiatica]
MAEASIDIEQMSALVSAMEAASSTVGQSKRSMTDLLSGVDVDTSSMNRLDDVGGWVSDQLPGVRRRLAMAEAIEAQTPGQQFVVTIDESLLSTLSPEEAREAARRAAELIAENDLDPTVSDELLDQYGLPQELLDLLGDNALDPYFAQELARTTSPEDVGVLVAEVAAYRQRVADSPIELVSLEDVDAQYESLLSGLGSSLGLATRTNADLRLPNDIRDRWVEAVSVPYGGLGDDAFPGQASALALVVSRGDWSTPFLYEAANQIYAREHLQGVGVWGDEIPLVAPGGDSFGDPLAGVLAAMGTNPEAAQWVFDDSTTPTVDIDGHEVELSGFLEYALRRGWQSDGGAGMQAALQAAVTPFEGGSTVSADIAAEASELIEAITTEQREAQEEHDRNWLSRLGHTVLDIVGLIPVLGEPADAVNAAWYSAEGDYVNAGLSAAGVIPVIGWSAVGGKWVRRTLSADELADISRQLEAAGQLPEGARVVNADPSAVVRLTTGGAPTGGVFVREKPEWLRNILRGNEFERTQTPNILAAGGTTQLRVQQRAIDPDTGLPAVDEAGNPVYRDSYPYNIVDGYIDGDQIIEIKSTQFAEVTEEHALREIRSLGNKYPPGTPIADVPSTPDALRGTNLNGRPVLLVPPQTADIPPNVLAEARRLGVEIRDSDGRIYT